MSTLAGGGDEGGGEGDGGGDGEAEKSEDGEVGSEEDREDQLELGPAHHRAIAPVTVPKWLPEVPVLTVTRNPLFPRFVKMLEVRSPNS